MNKLSYEKSPYLLQHKDNPVNWFPWGNEAFKAAKEQDKPIFLSIGYSTCYWCHVMEKDSFEKADVAAALNSDFICIKVDREERPDVDQIYMDTVVGLTGRGGWPMSVFLTPDLKPFWGGTFFYRTQFLSILEQVSNVWKKEKSSLIETSEKIHIHLKTHLQFEDKDSIHAGALDEICKEFIGNHDHQYGGFGSAPKFPPAMQLSFLMRVYKRTKDPSLLAVINKTLDCMAKGGIYDQLGGGFHRYSTDSKWLVPHFEKMLYDNSLLAVTYLEAYQLTKNKSYLEIAEEVLNYLINEMTDKQGGFYAAEDAGEVEREGEFYVWNFSEIESLLEPGELEAVQKIYDVNSKGNFENGKIILNIPFSLELDKKNTPLLKSSRDKLLKARALRARPHRDEKIITSWCSLAITAFSKAYSVTNNSKYLEAAENAAAFIENELFSGGILFRHYCNGKSEIPAFLEDYSFFIEALLNLYLADFNLHWYQLAKNIQKIQDKLFWDQNEGGYFTSTACELFIRKKEFLDNAVPSGNSVAFNNLVTFSALSQTEELVKKQQRLLEIYSPLVKRYHTAFSKFLQGMTAFFSSIKQLVLALEDRKQANNEVHRINQDFHPYLYILISNTTDDNEENNLPQIIRGKPAADNKYYLCRDFKCDLPEQNFEKILEILGEN